MQMSESFLTRGVNEGFSGGEKKRNEMLQMLCWSRSSRSSTRPTPASTSTRSRWSRRASTACGTRTRAVVLVTHYQRLLDYIVPDFVHVLSGGRILKSGDRSLALELERRGYDWVLEGEVA